MSGNRMVAHTAVTYSKYFLSVAFEAVTMALAIIVCNAFINAGLPSFTGDYSDWAKTLIYLCEMTFTITRYRDFCIFLYFATPPSKNPKNLCIVLIKVVTLPT